MRKLTFRKMTMFSIAFVMLLSAFMLAGFAFTKTTTANAASAETDTVDIELRIMAHDNHAAAFQALYNRASVFENYTVTYYEDLPHVYTFNTMNTVFAHPEQVAFRLSVPHDYATTGNYKITEDWGWRRVEHFVVDVDFVSVIGFHVRLAKPDVDVEMRVTHDATMADVYTSFENSVRNALNTDTAFRIASGQFPTLAFDVKRNSVQRITNTDIVLTVKMNYFFLTDVFGLTNQWTKYNAANLRIAPEEYLQSEEVYTNIHLRLQQPSKNVEFQFENTPANLDAFGYMWNQLSRNKHFTMRSVWSEPLNTNNVTNMTGRTITIVAAMPATFVEGYSIGDNWKGIRPNFQFDSHVWSGDVQARFVQAPQAAIEMQRVEIRIQAETSNTADFGTLKNLLNNETDLMMFSTSTGFVNVKDAEIENNSLEIIFTIVMPANEVEDSNITAEWRNNVVSFVGDDVELEFSKGQIRTALQEETDEEKPSLSPLMLILAVAGGLAVFAIGISVIGVLFGKRNRRRS